MARPSLTKDSEIFIPGNAFKRLPAMATTIGSRLVKSHPNPKLRHALTGLLPVESRFGVIVTRLTMNRITTSVPIAAAIALSISSLATTARAADLGGNCCADLEERIAELEASTARKGNRKVSLSVSGHVNKAILFWDDGSENNAYVVGNATDPSHFVFAGEATFAPGWKAGYTMDIWVGDNLTDGVDQTTDDGAPGFTIWESNWFVASEKYGKLTVGLAPRASDGVPEVDLSETSDAGYAGVQDVAGGFALRRKDGALAAPLWGDVFNHFNGDTADVVRYDSPDFAGFSVAASWGEDDIWDAALFYTGESSGFKLEGAVAYTESSDENGIDGSGEVPNSTVVGSVSLLHEPTGLNATIAAGRSEFDANIKDTDGQFRAPADAQFIYAKLGWITKLNGLGPTAFYGEYGHYRDLISAGLDADGVASLSLTDPANVCVAAGDACRVTGNEADVWGLGVVQLVEQAEMQIYLGWRRHSADFDLVDVNGSRVSGPVIEDFDTLIAGSKISF